MSPSHLGEVADEWIETFFKNCELADSTKALYEGNYRLYLRDSIIGQTALGDVTAMMIQQFYNTSKLKYSNLKAIDKFLKHFYRYCELTGICHDVTSPLRLPKKQDDQRLSRSQRIEVWGDKDLKKVIKALSGTKLRFLVILAVNTGARFSELLALRYDDINGNILTINKQITEVPYNGKKGIRLSDTKSACSNRQIILSEEVLAEFEKHKKIHHAEMMRRGYITQIIFSSDVGTYSSKKNIRNMLSKVYKRIGVPNHTFHSFRHTFATNLSRAGVPIERTSKLMGHSDITVTEQYYLAVGDQDKLDAVNKIVQFSFG